MVQGEGGRERESVVRRGQRYRWIRLLGSESGI